MRKSIYYLIANILSTIAAAIFIGVVNFQYPFFGKDLIVTGMSQNCWEQFKIILLVVALTIIWSIDMFKAVAIFSRILGM